MPGCRKEHDEIPAWFYFGNDRTCTHALLPLHQKVYGVAVTAVFTTILQALINVYIGKDSKLKTFNSKYAGKLTCPCCAKPLSEMEFKTKCAAAARLTLKTRYL